MVVLGCAHRGIINTLHYARELMGEERIHTVVGGTHLCDADEERIETTAQELKRLGVERMGASHCTGFVAEAHLLRVLGPDVFFTNNAGHVITFS